MSIFKDETGKISMARTLVGIWTVVIIFLIFFKLQTLKDAPALLTFFSGVYLYLCAWASGPRMVQYLAPIVSKITDSLSKFSKEELEGSTDLQDKVTSDEGK